ncbi:hypothetical protein [Bartonella sp. B30(2025)]
MKQKKQWGGFRVVFLANKDLILGLIEEGYSLKEILRKNPTLNIPYHSLASYVRKYSKNKADAVPVPTLTTSVEPITKKQASLTFKHNPNKKLEDMV